MRRSQNIHGVLLAVLAVAGFAFQLSAAQAFGACSNSDLRGRYIYQFAGITDIGGTDALIHETGVFLADGAGGLKAYAHTVLGGNEIAPPNTEAWKCEYDVAANCFATIVCDRIDLGVTEVNWSMVIEKSGQEVRFQAGGDQPAPFGMVQIQGEGRK